MMKDGYLHEVITCPDCRRILAAEEDDDEGVKMWCTVCGKKVAPIDLIRLIKNDDGELIPYAALRQ